MEEDKAIIPTRVYEPQEAAVLLGLNVQTVIRYCRAGKIKSKKVGSWKILGQSLLDFLQS